MKKLWCLVILAVLLMGCSQENHLLDRAMNLRAEMISRCGSFDAEVTADYGSKTIRFRLDCSFDKDGNLQFKVKEPLTLAGITGKLTAAGGKLTFDQTAMAMDTMADDQLSPVSAPWLLVKTLRNGYLTSCNEEDGGLRVAIEDNYGPDALHLDVWLDSNDLPRSAEIYWQGRRLLTVNVSNFVLE
jgi:outer membrane lipoprotein-sorting protein